MRTQGIGGWKLETGNTHEGQSESVFEFGVSRHRNFFHNFFLQFFFFPAQLTRVNLIFSLAARGLSRCFGQTGNSFSIVFKGRYGLSLEAESGQTVGS